MIAESQAMSSSAYAFNSEESSPDEPASEFNREVHVIDSQRTEFSNQTSVVRFENCNFRCCQAVESQNKEMGKGKELSRAPSLPHRVQ